MRKFAAVLFVLTVIIILSSCSIDDSNDIEVIKPGDTVITGQVLQKQFLK
ncbi:hypothetical protein D9V96_003805 [Zobellia laminariae]|uniref:Uncharacterized protein n=1 Tax=Zobellia barbeyronii TaxID=2748009 RepID=A0ABS5WG55_9FLAO|nr:hypothetical protein [Zobellia barbeyronii]MBT2162338.1 hypothetical protein [Zobellia barbeyronii]